jgi:O-antigen/teichoic acid export membrane protein
LPEASPIILFGRKLTRNASFLLAGQVALSALSVILTAALARWLGVVEFGLYYLVTSLSTFVYVFVDWGQSTYLIRESARRRNDRGDLLGGALVLRVAVAFVAALITAALVKVAGYDGRTEFLTLLAVVCGLPLALSQAYGYVFRGSDRMDLDAAVNITGKVLIVAITVPALYLGGGLPIVMVLQAAGGGGALLLAALVGRNIRVGVHRLERRILQALASNGTPIALFLVAMAVQPFIDAIVLSKLAPPQVVGYYGAARTIIGVLIAPAPIIGTAALPELSRMSASVQDLRLALRGTSRLLVGLGALAPVGTFQFADTAVGLVYGPGHFDPAIAVLQTFAPVLPLLFMDILFANAIIAVGNTKKIAVVKALSVAVATALSVLLIPVYQSRLGNGGIGLVLAFGLTEIMMLTAFL